MKLLLWLLFAILLPHTVARMKSGISDILKEKKTVVKLPLTVRLNGTIIDNHNCTFTIREHDCHGPEVTRARASTKLCFQWNCDLVGYGMRVESCSAESNLKSPYELMDNQGCSVENLLLKTPIYTDGNFSSAHASGLMFVFQNSNNVYYKCDIQLCDLCQCSTFTPPINCSDYNEGHANLKLRNETLNQTFYWCDPQRPYNKSSTAISSLILLAIIGYMSFL